jgi:predicted PurR-regulated permease PerM
MKNEVESHIRKYIFWGIILILIVSSYFIIQPYLIALITSFILAFLVKPVHTLISKRTNQHISAIICILLIIILAILPLATLTTGVVQQAYSSLNDESLRESINQLSNNYILDKINLDINDLRSKITNFLIEDISSYLSYLPSLLLSLLIMITSTYYILTSWNFLADKLDDFIPFSNKAKVVSEIAESTKAIVYGTILVAIIEGLVSLIGFSIINIPNSLLMATLIFFFAFIPGIGPAFVWVPVALYYFLTKAYTQSISVLILGLIISIGIDYLVRTKILGDTSKIHPLVMLVGILGGISIFGIFGFIIGPLILIYTIKFLSESVSD